MPKKQNQKLKLLTILRFLRERSDEEHPVSIGDIIGALSEAGIEAERKSIYSDLEALSTFGADIITLRGKKTGYYLGARTFETAELKLLVDAVQSSRFITQKKSSELIKKLATDASVYTAASLERQVQIANRVKTMNESIYYTVDILHIAISEKKKLSFLYYEWNAKKEKVLRHNGERYTVSPFVLSWEDENYYLIAYDHKSRALRHYRVDKMVDVAVLDEKREGEETFRNLDAGLYARSVFGMFGGERQSVTLRCESSVAGAMLDKFGQDVPFIADEEGYFRIHIQVSVSPQFYSWVFGFGGRVKILSPASVAEGLCRMAEETLSFYKSE